MKPRAKGEQKVKHFYVSQFNCSQPWLFGCLKHVRPPRFMSSDCLRAMLTTAARC